MATPMSRDTLVAVLQAEGITVEGYPNWRNQCRCHIGKHKDHGPYIRGWGNVNGTLDHITAGNLGRRTPFQYIRDIINGSKSIPLKSQMVVDPDGVLWLNSAGRANHAGRVSSASIAKMVAGSFSFSKKYDPHRGHNADGNSRMYGIEVIAAHHMNAKQYATLVKANAAIARHFGPSWQGGESAGHGECSDQRYFEDPGLDMGAFRTDVRDQINHPTQGDEIDMADINELTDAIRAIVKEEVGYAVWSFKNEALETADAYQILRDVRDTVAPDKAPTTEADAGGEPGKA